MKFPILWILSSPVGYVFFTFPDLFQFSCPLGRCPCASVHDRWHVLSLGFHFTVLQNLTLLLSIYISFPHFVLLSWKHGWSLIPLKIDSIWQNTCWSDNCLLNDWINEWMFIWLHSYQQYIYGHAWVIHWSAKDFLLTVFSKESLLFLSWRIFYFDTWQMSHTSAVMKFSFYCQFSVPHGRIHVKTFYFIPFRLL